MLSGAPTLMARRIAFFVAAVFLIPLLLLGALILMVQSEWGERWLERSVADRIHREVQVSGIQVRFEWPPALDFEHVRIGNPDWAKTHDLLDAEGLTAQIAPWPLFEGRLVIPYLHAKAAKGGLEQGAGRATWHFDQEQREPSRVKLEGIFLDDGHLVYRNEDEDTALELNVKGSLGAQGEAKFEGRGKFRGEPSKGSASILALEPMSGAPIRISGKASVGKTDLSGDGSFAMDLQSLDMRLKLAGQTLKDLHKVFGMVLPDTPPYKLAGELKHRGNDWIFDPFEGKVGDSDLRGNLVYAKGGERPLLRADLRSKLLDFNDLGPLVGAPPGTGPGETASPQQKAKAAAVAASDRILPHEKIATERWREMDADVKLDALRVLRPKQLPLDSLSTHLILKDAVLRLEPLNFGVAGGRVTSQVSIDSRPQPPSAGIKTEIQGLKLAELFPTLKTMEEALGTLYGRAELKGRGASVGDMLGTSNGKLVVAANGGRVSDLLIQLLEIDIAKAATLLGTKKQVDLRCAVGIFEVKDGVASPDSFIVDTTGTFVKVDGKIDLDRERLDLVAHARGKTPSPLVLRTPVMVEGPFKQPAVHVKAGPIVVQAGLGAALTAVNPLLALAPFLDRGSGKDADCDKLLADARAGGAVEKTKTAKSD